MKSGNIDIHNKTLSAVESLAQGDSGPIESMGISADNIHTIRNIMNIYSYQVSALLMETAALILRQPTPSQALNRLEQCAETAPELFELVSYSADLPLVLANLFLSSRVLAQRFGSDPKLIDYLSGLSGPLLPQTEPVYYRGFINNDFEHAETSSDKIKILHRIHTSQLIRICARNADIGNEIADITAELSALADSVIDASLKIALDELHPYAEQALGDNALFVLGLGKLGGRELNVGSDVDIIYLYDIAAENEAGPVNDTKLYEYQVFYTRVAERMTGILTEATESGYLYRVDTRLRADGSSGPLVRSADDYIRYLEMRGKAWERQMLLKARPSAGNIDAANAFLRSVERFIFTTNITRSPHHEIAAIKNQIEARIVTEGSKKTHLKLMPGGIRDIEFITQCLQLLMGGLHPEVQCTGTLPSLACLKKVDALSDDEYTLLREAYVLYRRIENVLQWRELLPAFKLPESPDEIIELTERLDVSNITAKIAETKTRVRAVFDDIFNAEKSESFDEMAVRAAVNPAGDDKVRRFLENLGFTDPEKSAKDISLLVFGRDERPEELSLHPSIERFLPKLLKKLSELSDPRGTLEHFKLIAESYNARAMLFDILEHNPRFFELLISITHGSVSISEILIMDPSLLDWLVESGGILRTIDTNQLKKELDAIDTKSHDSGRFTRECMKLKRREELRIGTRDISGLSETVQTFAELSTLAENIVSAAAARAYREISSEIPFLTGGYEFGIIAAGKLGCSRMNFGSDIDIIFVYKSSETNEDPEISAHSIMLAQRILAYITGGGGVYKLYDIDARLRPEGGNSPLAISIGEYKRYLAHRASVWERLAMIRSRCLNSPKALNDEIAETLETFVFGKPLRPSETKKIMDIRKSMIDNSAKRYPGLMNIKSGAGGIADIDFIAQSYAIHFGAVNPELRLHETESIIEMLGETAIISRHDASSLLELYEFLRDVEKSLRIGSGKPVNTLPDSGTELARVTRLMKYDNIRRFKKRLGDVTGLVRDFYNRLMENLLDFSSDSQT